MVRGGGDQTKFVYLDMPDFGLDVLLVQLRSDNLHLLSKFSIVCSNLKLLLVLETVQHEESGEFVQTI